MQKKINCTINEECTETVEEVKLANITLAENENSHKCPSCTPYTVSMIVVFTIFIEISAYLFITTGLWLKIMFRTSNLALVLKQRFKKYINGES